MSDEDSDCLPACSSLKRNFYVDDFIGGADTVEDALRLRKELAGFLPRSVPNDTVKALGISWKPESDELCFENNVRDEPTTLTRRSILSSIAKTYDPLGLIAPIIIRAKKLTHELWRLKSGWNDPVPDVICYKWKAIHSDWESL
uniref:Reverse transcriptase domain-containing protein n=1 Tax=Anopheles stephensi TaxID=30069 RepID=A0A182YT65_ANOST